MATLLYKFNYMIFWERKHYGDCKKVADCQTLERKKGWIGRGFSVKTFNGKTIPQDTIIVDTHHYTYVHIHGMYNSVSESYVNLGDYDVTM